MARFLFVEPVYVRSAFTFATGTQNVHALGENPNPVKITFTDVDTGLPVDVTLDEAGTIPAPTEFVGKVAVYAPVRTMMQVDNDGHEQQIWTIQGEQGPAGVDGGPIPEGGTAGDYPTPLVGGGHGWDKPEMRFAPLAPDVEYVTPETADATYEQGVSPLGVPVATATTEDPTIWRDDYARSSGVGPLEPVGATLALGTNRLQITRSATRGYALIPGFFSDYTDVETTLYAPSATNRNGLVARHVDDNNRGVTLYVSTDTSLALGRWVSGAFASLATVTYTAGVASIRVRLVIDGSSVVLYVNGALYGTYDLAGTCQIGRAGLICIDSQTGDMGFANLELRPKPRARGVYATPTKLLHSSGGYSAFPTIIRQADNKVYVCYVDGTSHTAAKKAYVLEVGTRTGVKVGEPVEVYAGTNEQDFIAQVVDGAVIAMTRIYDTAINDYRCLISSGASVTTLGARAEVAFDQFPAKPDGVHAAWFGKIIKSLDGTKYLAPVYGYRTGFTYFSVGLFECPVGDLTTWTLRSWIVPNDGDTLAGEHTETSILRLPDDSIMALCRGNTFAQSGDDGLTWITRAVAEPGPWTETNPTVQAPRIFLVSDQLVALFRYQLGHRVFSRRLYSGPFTVMGSAPRVAATNDASATDGAYMDAIPSGDGLLCVDYNREQGDPLPSLYTFRVLVR